jgi:hypothetical protein
MFCPVCKDEFRSGFTRCAACEVALVEDLSRIREPVELPAEGHLATVELADFCGFVSLAEAREARETLRREGIRSEIAIREAPESALAEETKEEYWLRVDHSRYAVAARLIGYDLPEAPPDFDMGEGEEDLPEDGRKRS